MVSLRVRVIRTEGVPEVRGMFMKEVTNHLIKLKLGDQEKSTTVKYNGGPSVNFDESFFFDLNEETHLVVELYNAGRWMAHELLGTCQFPLSQNTLKSGGWEGDVSFLNAGSKARGRARLSVEVLARVSSVDLMAKDSLSVEVQ